MLNPPERTSGARGRWLLGLCIFFSLILAWGDNQSDGMWRRFLALAIAPLDRAVADVSAAFRLREQTAYLAAELAKSRQEVWRYKELVKENDALTALLALHTSLSYESLPARVINYQTDGLRAELTVDVGEYEGAESSMAVLAPDGLVGRVVRVYPHTSLVRLINDPEERVSCRVYNSRSFCVLRTDQVGRPRLDYLSSRAEVSEGDAIVTSGMGGVYPAGVPVGSIDNLEVGQEQLFYSATLRPYVNFGSLEVVVLAKPLLRARISFIAPSTPITAPAPKVQKPLTPAVGSATPEQPELPATPTNREAVPSTPQEAAP